MNKTNISKSFINTCEPMLIAATVAFPEGQLLCSFGAIRLAQVI